MKSSYNYADTRARADFLAALRGAAQTPKVSDGIVPNRSQLRRRGINVTRRMGRTHARVRSGAKLTPASFFTLVQIRQPIVDGIGRTTGYKKLVVPRNSVDDV
jgi:hypothetical protein